MDQIFALNPWVQAILLICVTALCITGCVGCEIQFP